MLCFGPRVWVHFPMCGGGVPTPGRYLPRSYTLDAHMCMGLYDDIPLPTHSIAEIRSCLAGGDKVCCDLICCCCLTILPPHVGCDITTYKIEPLSSYIWLRNLPYTIFNLKNLCFTLPPSTPPCWRCCPPPPG